MPRNFNLNPSPKPKGFPFRYGRSYDAFHLFVKQYNEKQVRNRDLLKVGHWNTMEILLSLFGLTIKKPKAYAQLDIDNPPPIVTHNGQLACMCYISRRTVQNNLRDLEKVGLIRKVWRGSHNAYHIFINPEILLLTGSEVLNNVVNSAKPLDFFGTGIQSVNFYERIFLPHSYASYTKNNNIIIAVDNLKKSFSSDTISAVQEQVTSTKRSSLPRTQIVAAGGSDPQGAGLETPAGNTGECPFQKNEKTKQNGGDRRQTGGGAKKIRDLYLKTGECVQTGYQIESEAPPLPSLSDTRCTILSEYTQKLWQYAVKKLYANRFLAQSQVKTAQNLIRKWYEPVPLEKLERVHQVYLERIDIVEKYIARDPKNRFVQLPDRYFRIDNPNGFTGTKKWHENQRTYRAKLREDIGLFKALRYYQKVKEKTTGGISKPLIQVYRECETWIKRNYSPLLLQRFYKEILEYQTGATNY